MQLRSRAGVALAVLAVLMALPVVAEDLTIVSTISMGKGRTMTSTQYLTSEKVRTSSGDTDTIMDYSSGVMTMIDHKKKQYYQTTAAEMAAYLEQLTRSMQGGPMAALFGGTVEQVRVQKGAGSRKIAGYDCQEYVLTMGEGMRFDVWAAPGLPAPHQYYEAARAPYAAMGPMGQKFQKMFEEMKKIKGYPLGLGINAKMMMIKMDSLQEATEVRKGAVPDSAFEVPGGYKQKESPFKKK